MPRVRVGCAGWSIPAAHRTQFGPGDSVLARYATVFDSVEINSAFYRSHQRATYARWAASVPSGFRFSVKLPRTITHDARLRDCGALLDTFLEQCGGLGRKLGALLVQLPPSLAYDGRHAAAFFAMLRRRHDGPVACEPRHATWFAPAADALLQRHGIHRVAADPAPVPGAEVPGGDTGSTYWRLHGSPRIYYSEYGRDALGVLADALRSAGRGTWCVFDNTAHGHAVGDALKLRALLGVAATR